VIAAIIAARGLGGGRESRGGQGGSCRDRDQNLFHLPSSLDVPRRRAASLEEEMNISNLKPN
jgi:hypothetical protein